MHWATHTDFSYKEGGTFDVRGTGVALTCGLNLKLNLTNPFHVFANYIIVNANASLVLLFRMLIFYFYHFLSPLDLLEATRCRSLSKTKKKHHSTLSIRQT